MSFVLMVERVSEREVVNSCYSDYRLSYKHVIVIGTHTNFNMTKVLPNFNGGQ